MLMGDATGDLRRGVTPGAVETLRDGADAVSMRALSSPREGKT
jgi:hypothetical protein